MSSVLASLSISSGPLVGEEEDERDGDGRCRFEERREVEGVAPAPARRRGRRREMRGGLNGGNSESERSGTTRGSDFFDHAPKKKKHGHQTSFPSRPDRVRLRARKEGKESPSPRRRGGTQSGAASGRLLLRGTGTAREGTRSRNTSDSRRWRLSRGLRNQRREPENSTSIFSSSRRLAPRQGKLSNLRRETMKIIMMKVGGEGIHRSPLFIFEGSAPFPSLDALQRDK